MLYHTVRKETAVELFSFFQLHRSDCEEESKEQIMRALRRVALLLCVLSELSELLVNEKLHFTEHSGISEKFPFFVVSSRGIQLACVGGCVASEVFFCLAKGCNHC